MKKILSVVTMLGVMCGAASAAPYVLPKYQPGALTSYDIQPVYSVEGLYGIADDSDAPDTYGGRLSFNLYSDGTDTVRQQFNLNWAGMWGDKTYNVEGGSYTTDVFMMPLTAGYNINLELTDDVMFYVGGKAGYSWGSIDFGGDSVDVDGFHFSVGGGLKFQCSEAVYVNVGYEYAKTYIDDSDFKYNYGQHVISIGLGCQF